MKMVSSVLHRPEPAGTMPLSTRQSMALITPSFAPDFERCVDLHWSILENAPDNTQHKIIVPREDMELFGQLAGERTQILCESDFLPRSFVPVPFCNYTFNTRRPFPPVRGWILQQVVKLAAAAALDEDVVVLVDSDIEFVRPFTVETFANDGQVRFYRKLGAVDEQLPRHMIWHRVARSLLGLAHTTPPYTDYIASLIAWNPKIVRQMLDRLTAITGRPWATSIAAQLHFSEWTLYGVFVDNVLGAPANAFASDDPHCLAHWGTTPLTPETADHFLRSLQQTDVAAMISAKSGTPLDVKRAAFAAYRASRWPGAASRLAL